MIGVRHRNVSSSTIEKRYYDDKYLLRGICKKCHTNETYRDTTLCLVCLIDQRERQKNIKKIERKSKKKRRTKTAKDASTCALHLVFAGIAKREMFKNLIHIVQYA